MIFGGCPYCDRAVVNYMPDESPKFAKPTCEHCGKQYWLLCSRIESTAFTVEDFNKDYVVNEETKEIVERHGTRVA